MENTVERSIPSEVNTASRSYWIASTETTTPLGLAAIMVDVTLKTMSWVTRPVSSHTSSGQINSLIRHIMYSFQFLKASSRPTEPREEPMTIMERGMVAAAVELVSSRRTSGTGGCNINIPRATKVASQRDGKDVLQPDCNLAAAAAEPVHSIGVEDNVEGNAGQ